MWQTVSARIRGTKAELEALGEETDNIMSSSKLRDLVRGYTGVDIMEDDNTYKDMYTIIKEIGKEWKNLEDVEQAALLEALAGKKQSNTLAAVLNNYERLEDIYETAEGSAGSAREEQEKYTKSVQYSIDQLTAHTEEFWHTFINTDDVKTLIDILNSLISKATAVVDTFGALPTTAGVFGIFAGIKEFKEIQSTMPMIEGVIDKVKNISIGDVGVDGTFDSATLNEYVSSLRGLTETQAKVVLSSTNLDKVQKQQILNKLAETSATVTLTSAEATAAVTRTLGSQADAEALLVKSGLVTEEELLAGTTLEVTGAKIADAVATGALTKEEGLKLASALGLSIANAGLATSFKLLAASIWGAITAMAKWLFTNPLGWTTLAIAGMSALCNFYDDLIGKRAKLARQRIKSLDEDIAKLDEEISSLETLQDKLIDARGDKAKLAEIQSELNSAIGDTTKLLNLEGDAYTDANERIAAQIALKEKLRKQAQDDRIKESKALFNNNPHKEYGLFGWDFMNPDSTGAEMRALAKNFGESGYMGILHIDSKSWQKYWNEQVEIAYDIFDETIKSYDGVGGEEFIKGLISKTVRNGYDLDEIASTIDEIINNNEFTEAVNNYWDSLTDPNAKTGDALKVLEDVFAGIVEDRPVLGAFFEDFKKGIIAGGDAAKKTSKEIKDTTIAISNLEKASEKFKTLGSAFKEFSEEGYVTTKTLGEIKSKVNLSDEAWAEYENKLLSVKLGSAEFNQIISELTYSMLEAEFSTLSLAGATDEEVAAIENKIAATLRESGANNANAVAREFLNGVKAKEKIASMELTNTTDLSIEALYREADACGVTANAYLELVAKEIVFNRNDLDVNQKVAQLNKVAVAAGLATINIEALGAAMSTPEKQKQYVIDNGGSFEVVGFKPKGSQSTTDIPTWKSVNKSITYQPSTPYALLFENSDMFEPVYEFTSADGTVIDDFSTYVGENEMAKKVEELSNAVTHVTVPNYSGALSGGSGGSGNEPDYEDPTEAIINSINLRTKQLEQQEEYMQNAIDIAEAEEDYGRQISLTNAKLDIQKQRMSELITANANLHQMAEDARNSTPWNEDEWFDSQGNATITYINLYNGSSKEAQEQLEAQFEKVSKIKEAYKSNEEEILSLSQEILQGEEDIWDIRREIFDARMEESEYYIQHSNDFGWENGDNEVAARKRVLDWIQTDYYKSLIKDDVEYYKILEENRLAYIEAQKEDMEKSISDIEDYIEARNLYNDWGAYGDSEVKAIQRQTKIIKKAYKDRLLSYDEYIDRLEDNRQNLYSLAQSEVDKHLSNIDNYISARNHYNDWDDFNDSEIKAIKRQCEVLDEAYRLNLMSLEEYTEKSAEYTQKLYSVAKESIVESISELVEDYEEIRSLESSQYSSLKTLLQSYYDVTNAVSEAQHEINKELQASQSMYEYLNEETRKLLFNQEDYNALNEKLLEIQSDADELQKQYQEDILDANAETIAEITEQYQMQYDTMIKQYEIAKAELEVAKKRQKLDNVLAERNTRMFINGQWQWVAKTQDVINAQNELADAEIERKKQEASLEQTEAINEFTEQINAIETELNKIKKYWSDMQEMLNGESDEVAKALQEISQVSSPELKRVIDVTGGTVTSFSDMLSESTITLSDIIDGDHGLGTMSTSISTIITDLESYSDAIKALIKTLNDEEDNDSYSGKTYKVNANGKAPAGLKVGDRVVTAGGTYEIEKVYSDGSYKSTLVDSSTTTSNYKGSYAKAPSSSSSGSGSSSSSSSGGKTVQVNPDGKAPAGLSVGDKVVTAGGTYKITGVNSDGSYKSELEKHADGTRYTPGGLTALGEEGFEAFITDTGRLIPINQPTIGNIGAGGIVFNREQMANLRNLWDLSNLGKVSPFVSASGASNQSTVIDNSIHINGMTIEEKGNEDWINGFRRYVATHK